MQLPARIGKYELQEFLGGGMSHVYRAIDTVIGRTVAVKILTDAGCQDAEAKQRFLAEARMAGNLAHDNVLGIYDFGEDEQHRPFMVMEFLRGQDLRHAIDKRDTGDLRNKLKIALQVACALGYVHEQKIIHRDIKPENIHINTAGVVKLMDFGIAKAEGLQLTRVGYVLGTAYYMAPEQVTGENITQQLDVYAFGVLLFELLTGKKAVTGDALGTIFYSILNEPLKMEPLHEAGVPRPVCELISRCTAKNPAERPQGFETVCQDLERAIAEADAPALVLPGRPRAAAVVAAVVESGPAAGVAGTPAPGLAATGASRPGWLLPVVLLAIVALGAGLYFARKPGSQPTPRTAEGPLLAQTLHTLAGEMVLVPAGNFQFGEKKESVFLPAFYIDKTEVSNRAYAQFCKETKHALPESFAANKPDYPVVYILIQDARAFAQWAGKRLPTGREWEKAARGKDGFLYPWGNDPDPARANIGSDRLMPVSALPSGASPYGALNMLGNVWELVDELSPPGPVALAEFTKEFAKRKWAPPTPEEPWHIIRGLSIGVGEKLDPNGLWDISTVPERGVNFNIGFRCVKDAQ